MRTKYLLKVRLYFLLVLSIILISCSKPPDVNPAANYNTQNTTSQIEPPPPGNSHITENTQQPRPTSLATQTPVIGDDNTRGVVDVEPITY